MENKFITSPALRLIFLSIGLLLASCKKDGSVEKSATGLKLPANVSINTKSSFAAISPTEVLQTVSNGTFFIVNLKSGKVLDVSGLQTSEGSNVVQYGATGGANEKWTLTQVTGGYYSIIDNNSGKALQVDQSGTADGSNVNIGTYSSSANNQQWQFISIGNGYYRIVNKNSGKDLDVNGQSLDDLANVQQWSYWGGENQQWALLRVTANGHLTWTLTTTGVPTDVQQRITTAMNDACARYNAGADWPARTLTVEYNTDVPTADGNASTGNIRFGSNASYQTVRTVMHEIAHTYGVGQNGGWYSNTSSGDFLGTNTVATIHALETSTSAIHTGGGHFWPYGLNYDDEWSETNAFRQVKIVYAMRADGM